MKKAGCILISRGKEASLAINLSHGKQKKAQTIPVCGVSCGVAEIILKEKGLRISRNPL
jgi:hypothetical protein